MYREREGGRGGTWIILEDGTLPWKKKDIIKLGPVLMTRTCYCLSPLQVQVPHFEGKAVVTEELIVIINMSLHRHTQVAKEVFDFFFLMRV